MDPALSIGTDSQLTGASLTPAPDTFKKELSTLVADPSASPAAIIRKLKELPRLAFLFAQDSRVMEQYTIEEHTTMVLAQFDKYLADVPLPAGLTAADLRIALALHDIGKSIPADKRDQHKETLKVLESLEQHLPWTDEARRALTVLIGGDSIGGYLRKYIVNASVESRLAIAATAKERTLTFEELSAFAALVTVNSDPLDLREAATRAAAEIARRAQDAGLGVYDFWKLQLLYYQADTSAYTYDAAVPGGKRASPGLDFLYELDPDFSLSEGKAALVKNGEGGLRFSPGIKKMVSVLDEEVRALAAVRTSHSE